MPSVLVRPGPPVLAADDEAAIRGVVAAALVEEGDAVAEAADGAAALACVRAAPPCPPRSAPWRARRP